MIHAERPVHIRARETAMKRQQTATLTAKQDRTAVLLATGVPIKDAANQVGAGERAVHTWLEDDKFTRLIDRYPAKLIGEMLGRLIGSATYAVQALVDCLGSQESDSVKVRASLGILDQVIRIRAATDIERRPSEIESRLRHVHQSET
jgi:hypothetical protein